MTEKPLPKLLVVGGMQRGGSTMLREFLRSHPHIELFDHEHNSIMRADHPTMLHLLAMGWHTCRRVFRRQRWHRVPEFFRYARALLHEVPLKGFVTLDHVHRAIATMLANPDTVYVGDKQPAHIEKYPLYIHRANTKCIFIYRDPRDVIASTLQRVRTDWSRNGSWVSKFDSIDKLCHYWLTTIRYIQDLQKLDVDVYIVRYEDLVQQPEIVGAEIGTYLDVDGTLFNMSIPNRDSIGKYQQTLTDEEVEHIHKLLADKMTEFNYS